MSAILPNRVSRAMKRPETYDEATAKLLKFALGALGEAMEPEEPAGPVCKVCCDPVGEDGDAFCARCIRDYPAEYAEEHADDFFSDADQRGCDDMRDK